jgi:hypothetical protein
MVTGYIWVYTYIYVWINTYLYIYLCMYVCIYILPFQNAKRVLQTYSGVGGEENGTISSSHYSWLILAPSGTQPSQSRPRPGTSNIGFSQLLGSRERSERASLPDCGEGPADVFWRRRRGKWYHVDFPHVPFCYYSLYMHVCICIHIFNTYMYR